MSAKLKKEFRYYLKNENRFIKNHYGKVVVIKGKKELGFYNSDQEAMEKTVKAGHKLGTFLIQACLPGATEQQAYASDEISMDNVLKPA